MDNLTPWSAPLPPSFSLQNALSASGTLYTHGCNQTDGTQNCTATCSDPYQAFQTLESLNNCVLYIGVAGAYANQSLSNNATKVADDFMIQKGDFNSSISQSINNTITACFDAYCHNSDCTALMSTYPFNDLHDRYYLYNAYYFSVQFDELCGLIAPPVSLNADIGGIGVYASYWIQSGLALLGTYLVLLWGWGTHYLFDPIMAGRRGSNANKPLKVISATFKNRRLARLTAAMTDFQKAQCFFTLAVNIAALANKFNGGLSPVSLQQLFDNYSLLASVAISGCLPITTTLLALHMVDMISGYLLALSGCTVALSIATVAAIGIFKPSRGDLKSIHAQASTGTASPKCGGFDLTVYCLQSQDNNLSNIYVWGIMAYCLVVLFFIFAYHLNAFKEHSKNEARPWVLGMASFMGSVRTLQLMSTSAIVIFSLFWLPGLILVSLTLAYLTFVPIFGLCSTRRINSAGFLSIRCGFDLLLLLFWLAGSISSGNPLGFLIWVTFIISTVQLLRKAYVEETKIRTWILKYRHFAHRDETLPTLSLGNRSIGAHLRIFSPTFMKASITLATLLSKPINKLEERAASHDWPRKYRRFLVICLYWIIFSGGIVCFVFEFRGLASFQAQIEMHSWTFGQIVAITIWAPPLCEYFHLELRGMKRGFQHRLLPPYKIIATATPSPSSATGSRTRDRPHHIDVTTEEGDNSGMGESSILLVQRT